MNKLQNGKKKKKSNYKIIQKLQDFNTKTKEKRKNKSLEYINKTHEQILSKGKGKFTYEVFKNGHRSDKNKIISLVNTLNGSLPDYLRFEIWITSVNGSETSYSIKLVSKRIEIQD